MNDNMDDDKQTPQNGQADNPEKEKSPPEEKTLEQQISEFKEQHLRDQAEMENLRKRMGREMEKARLFAIENFARDLLPVMDNMRRALAVLEKDKTASPDANADSANMKDGILMTLRETEAVLARHDIHRIKAEGQAFNPNQHEALFEVASSTLPAGAVAEIIEEGYMIGARLLRPARVGVARAEQKAEKNPENSE